MTDCSLLFGFAGGSSRQGGERRVRGGASAAAAAAAPAQAGSGAEGPVTAAAGCRSRSALSERLSCLLPAPASHVTAAAAAPSRAVPHSVLRPLLLHRARCCCSALSSSSPAGSPARVPIGRYRSAGGWLRPGCWLNAAHLPAESTPRRVRVHTAARSF